MVCFRSMLISHAVLKINLFKNELQLKRQEVRHHSIEPNFLQLVSSIVKFTWLKFGIPTALLTVLFQHICTNLWGFKYSSKMPGGAGR
jgi:hypothetical protein